MPGPSYCCSRCYQRQERNLFEFGNNFTRHLLHRIYHVDHLIHKPSSDLQGEPEGDVKGGVDGDVMDYQLPAKDRTTRGEPVAGQTRVGSR